LGQSKTDPTLYRACGSGRFDSSRHHWQRTVASAVLLSIALLPAACERDTSSSKGTKSRQAPAPTPVVVVPAEQKTVPLQLREFGTVDPLVTVSVKSQVGGELRKANVVDGQEVAKGSILFEIDPRPYEAALRQAEANLAKDEAQSKNAETEVTRAAELLKKGIMSQEDYDNAKATADALTATIESDKAAIENAKVQLSYCTIRSPVDARAGMLLVDTGNIVKANDVPLVVLNQIAPVYITFTVPEKELLLIRRYQDKNPLKVEAMVPGDPDGPEQGVLTFIDNTVDTTTGTVRLRGTFINRERHLWPGQFLRVTLTLTDQPNAIVVPTPAIQTGQQGQYVFVVKPDMTAEMRPVEVDRALNDETVISKGLKAGEQVVTDGQFRLLPGSKVVVKPRAQSARKTYP
jgi:membrane fusion protein, multidrug efflux system